MNKITEKQIRLLILLALVLIFFGCYRFGYLHYTDQAERLEEENLVLLEEATKLEILAKGKEQCVNEIRECKATIEQIKSKYGPGNTAEKSLLFLDSLEENASMTIPSVAFGQTTELFSSSTVPSVDGNGIRVLLTPLSISYQTTYEGLKRGMDYINQLKERMNVDSITASYDATTGNLTGTMMIQMYAMLGTEKEYQIPEVSEISIGTDNLFGTAEFSIIPKE